MLRYLAIAALAIITACAPTGERITDFSTRSTVYGWLDVDEIQGNHLYSMVMRQYAPESDLPYIHMGVKKMEGGYLFWHHGFPNGAFEFDVLRLQSCLAVICSNTINEYAFRPFGTAPGKVSVRQPGVYYAGNFELETTKRGFFRPGEFDVRKTRSGPSRAQLLAALAGTAPKDHPVVDQRLRRAMGGR